jgi:hypothetical protein
MVLAAAVVAAALFWLMRRGDSEFAGTYAPSIDPANFTPNIAHRLMSLPPGRKLVYSGKTDEGTERVEIESLAETKTIMGVVTRVVRDKAWVNNVLVEDTRDYFAQDKDGNVWYFGEDVDNFAGGALKDHAGSWIAGVDGALPGIVMRSEPRVGDAYRQEYYVGEAEDVAKVLSVSASVSAGGKQYANCLQTLDTSLIDKELKEHKYYCPEVGALVLAVDLVEDTREELTDSGPPVPLPTPR